MNSTSPGPGNRSAAEPQRGFFAENWPWIVVPFVLVLGAMAAFVMSTGGDDSGENPFVYNVF
jgi:hypothetical protein